MKEDNQTFSKKKSIGVIGLKGLPAFGGAATVGQSLIEEMGGKYDFTVYSVASHTNQKGDMGAYHQIVFSAFPVRKLNVFFYYLKSALYVLFKKKHDLIHLHHIDGAFILPLLRLRYKVVLTSHARPQLANKWSVPVKIFFAINERIAIRMANTFICVAKSLTTFYSNSYSRRFIHIPNGVSLNGRTQHNVPYDNYILFAAGRIIPLKGLHLLLQALKKINFRGKLLVLGDLDQMPSYKEKILALSKALDVEFLGLIREKSIVFDFLEHAKLFVFPSYSENMSMMLLEAASAEVPIVCSDITANLDVFNRNEEIFFESNNYVDLADKIAMILDKTIDTRSFIRKAKERLKTTYQWDKIALQYDKIYEMV